MIGVNPVVRRFNDLRFVLVEETVIRRGRISVFNAVIHFYSSSIYLHSCQVWFRSFPEIFALVTHYANAPVGRSCIIVPNILTQKLKFVFNH